jgi:hypothetical protein
VTLEEYAARLLKRAPVTSARVELLQLPTGWALVAVPSERVLETWEADEEATARRMFGLVAKLAAAQRAYATRPNGTCPRCAGPLQMERAAPPNPPWPWCPTCQLYVQPAGPRVDADEQAVRDQQRADTAAHVERLRGPAT